MSVFLKPGEVKVRDENGNYKGINILAEKSVQEYLDAIEEKGEQTKASIPEDYGTLAEDVWEMHESFDAAKLALLDCLEHVGWIDANGIDYFNALMDALNVERLPNEYIRYDYIEKAPGLSGLFPESKFLFLKQYSNLNNYDYEFSFSVVPGGAASGNCVFGGRLTGPTNSLAFYGKIGSTSSIGSLAVHSHGRDWGWIQNDVVNVGRKNRAVFKNGSGFSILSINGSTPAMIQWEGSDAINTRISLLGNWSANSGLTSQGIAYGCRCGDIYIKTGSTVIAHYVPCVRKSDNVIGMYETVEKRFYTASDTTATTYNGEDAVFTVGKW